MGVPGFTKIERSGLGETRTRLRVTRVRTCLKFDCPKGILFVEGPTGPFVTLMNTPN